MSADFIDVRIGRKRDAVSFAQELAARLEPTHPDVTEADALAVRMGRAEDLAQLDALGAELEALTAKHPASDTGESSWQPFPVEVLPAPVARYVRKASRAVGCDQSYVALPLLSALASAVGGAFRVELKPGWTEPAIIWSAIIGESGTQKSPALELALRPVRNRQRAAMRRYSQERERYDAEMLIYERDLSRWKHQGRETDPPSRPVEPIAERTWVSDITTEALAARLRDNPRGLLLACDELSAWLDFDRYSNGKGGDAARWLEVYGGRSLMVDRRGGPSLYVPRATVSVCGGIQPRILARAIGEVHRADGLLARLVLASPPVRVKRWTDAGLSPGDESDIAAVFGALYDLPPGRDSEGEECPRVIGLDPEARALWVEFFTEHAQALAAQTGDLAAAFSKLEGYCPRFALVFQLCRAVYGEASLDHVDAESMRAAIAVVRWFRAEIPRCYRILGEGEPERRQRELVEFIARKDGAVTARDLQRGPARFRGNAEAAENALRELEAEGLVVCEDSPQERGGWPVRVYRLTGTAAPLRHSPGNPGANGRVSLSQGAGAGADGPSGDWRSGSAAP